MAVVQVPPPVGTSGQFIDALVITSSTLRQVHVIADPVSSSAFATVTTSGGLSVNVTNPSTAVTITNPSTQVNTISSGPILISGTVTVLSASSGLVQISGNPTVLTASSGYLVRSLSSGTVTLSSNLTIISASSGVVQALFPVMSSAGFGPVTSSYGVAVNLLSTANVVQISSGVVTPSSNWTVISTATTITSGTITLSSATSLSSGTVTLSSAPLVIVASSGGTIPVTLSTVFSLSSVPTVTATAATNPWSSAPGFNMPVVSVSSGLVQISGAVASASSGFVQAWLPTQTGAGFGQVTSSGGQMVGLGVNSAAGYGTVTSSWGVIVQPAYSQSSSRLIVATTVGKISSAPGVLTRLNAYTTLSSAITGLSAWVRLYDQTTGNATSANNAGLAGASFLGLIAISTGGATVHNTVGFDFDHGLKFATACSFDIVLLATSTAAQLGGWVSAQYTS